MNPQLHPRSLLVSAHAYRPCVSRRSKKVAGHLAAGSRLLKIVLPAVPCRQGRPTQCLKPRAENTRIGSDPSKAHRIGAIKASFKSLYLKRPQKQPRGPSLLAGAPDTALRLCGKYGLFPETGPCVGQTLSRPYLSVNSFRGSAAYHLEAADLIFPFGYGTTLT